MIPFTNLWKEWMGSKDKPQNTKRTPRAASKMPLPKLKQAQAICLICLKRFRKAEYKDVNVNCRNQSHQYQHRVISPSIYAGIIRNDICEDSDEIGNNTEAGEKFPLEQNDIYTKLLQFSSRYLKLKTTTEPLLESFKNGREEGNNFEAFCDDCLYLVSYVCDLYTELQIVRLHLVWKLSELGGKLTESKKLVSHRLGGTLTKSVAKQLNVTAVKKLETFRKAFEIRCIKKGTDCSPKPVVPRGLFPEGWTHKFSDTKKTLMHLIVVFLLASSHIYGKRKEPKEAVVPTHDKGPPALRKRSVRRRSTPLKKKSKNNEELQFTIESELSDGGPCDWSTGGASPTAVSSSSDVNFQPEDVEDKEATVRNRIRRLKTKPKLVNNKKRMGNRFKGPLPPKKRKSGPMPIIVVHKCNVCEEEFPSMRHIIEHLESAHEHEEKTNQCWFCPKKFTVFQTLQFHRQKRHKKTQFRCASLSCTENFQTLEEHDQHLIKHLTKESVGKAAENEAMTIPKQLNVDVMLELKQEESTMVREAMSQTVVSQQPAEVEPIMAIDEGTGQDAAMMPPKHTVIRCSKCNWGFFDQDLLTFHEMVHQEIVDEFLKCPKCDSFYRTVLTLEQHYDEHHKRFIDRPYECLECHARMTSKKSLELHIERHNNRKGREPAVCPHCGFRAKDEERLRRHMKRHDPNHAVQCSEEGCEEKFVSETALARHVKRVHRSDGRSNCPICGVEIVDRMDVKSHISAVHSGKLHVCDICGKGYKRKRGLTDHVERTHTNPNVAAHVCSECGMAYKTDSGLKFHIASVHTPDSEKRFECPYCKKRSHRKHLMEMHIKTCSGQSTSGPRPPIAKYPAKYQFTGMPGRSKKVIDGEEIEMTDKSTSDEDDTMEEKVMSSPNQSRAEFPVSTSSSASNAINMIVSNLTGISSGQQRLDKTSTATTTTGDNVSVTKNQLPPGTSSSTSSVVHEDGSAFQSTVDHMLMQNILQQQHHQNMVISQHPLGSSSSMSSTTHSSYSPSQNSFPSNSFLLQQQQQLHQQHNRQALSQYAPEDHYHPNQISMTYSPNHVYPPPQTEQPQNLHKSK